MSINEKYSDSGVLLNFILRNLKTLIVISSIAAILSAIISLLIPNKFKSEVIIYPSSTSSISKALININSGAKTDLMEFGEEEKTEQLLQVLSSDMLRNEVINKFDLMKHYEIDTSDDNKFTQLKDKFESNIKFKRNEYMAVEISVMDEDPKKAAEIANGITDILDARMNSIQKERAIKGFQIVEKTYNDYVVYVKGLEDSLKFIMSMGVHDFEKQSEVLTQAYAEAVTKNNKTAINAINEKLDMISKYGAQQYNLKEKLQNAAIQFNQLKEKYEEAKIDANEKMTNFFVVDHATPAEKKSYPMRSLIVLVSTVCTAIFTLLILLIAEKIKEFKNPA